MGIYQRGKIWWIDYYYKGQRLREPVSESRKEAMEALLARQGDIVKGKFELERKRRSCSFEEFAVEFLKYLKATRQWWTREASRLKSMVRYFRRRDLSEISAFDVEKYKAKRRKAISGPGVNRELALLKSMFNKAAKWGFEVPENPVRHVKFYPERQMERILAPDEAQRLLKASGKSLRPVLILALNTGMRKSELLELRWENVSFGRRYIRVERSKNNRSRKIPMNSAVYEELSSLSGKGSPFVFTKGSSTERLRCVASAFKTACRRAGIEGLRFHDLRHTFATNLVMAGIDLVTVKEILGHSDISMTVRYSHPSDERKMEAVERLVNEGEEGVSRRDGHNLVTIPDSGDVDSRVTH